MVLIVTKFVFTQITIIIIIIIIIAVSRFLLLEG